MTAAEVIAEALMRDAFGLTTHSAVARQAVTVLAALEAAGYRVVKETP